MTFALSLSVVLSFLVPGVLVVVALAQLNATIRNLLSTLLAKPDSSTILIFLGLAFVAGSVVDQLRPLLDSLLKKISPRMIELNYLQGLTNDRLEVFKTLVENTHAYYRLNANTALALALLNIIIYRRSGLSGPLWALILLTLLIVFRAFRARQESAWAMNQFADDRIRQNAIRKRADEISRTQKHRDELADWLKAEEEVATIPRFKWRR
ncbi:MAG: hypothetical protein ACLQDV_25340 [Candidatus Binataceae bacterium]